MYQGNGKQHPKGNIGRKATGRKMDAKKTVGTAKNFQSDKQNIRVLGFLFACVTESSYNSICS